MSGKSARRLGEKKPAGAGMEDGMGLNQQIICLSNEIKRRKKKYPALVEKGYMTEQDAVYEIAAMQAAMETLSQLKGIAERSL